MSDQEAAAEIANLMDEASGDIAIGELEAAIEKYRQCITLDPEFFDGWHSLGMALMKTGHHLEAIEAGLKATQLRPNDQLAWSSLSMFYVRNHQITEAESAGAKARILSWGAKIAPESPTTN
jgi:tetratricopeptide (TPR) repeat protein